MKTFLMKFLKYIFAPLLVIALLWVMYFLVYANFHKVDKELYRSAQLRPFNMGYFIEKHNIKSILNLRGVDLTVPWYNDEIAFCKKNKVKHYNYGILDRSTITMEQMDEIVRIMKEAPKPLLIHCKAGADRTSLGAALYLHALKNDKDAESELSILYGHFPWLGSKTYFMDDAFENYKKTHPLKQKNEEHN